HDRRAEPRRRQRRAGARRAVGRERRDPDARPALDHAVLPREGAARARPARARARRAAVPDSRAGGRVLPVAMAARPADSERRALSALEGGRRARAVRALLLPRARRAVGPQGRMRADLLCAGRRDGRARPASARAGGARGVRRGRGGAVGSHRADGRACAAMTATTGSGAAPPARGDTARSGSADTVLASAPSEPQAARAVLMIRPKRFGANVETAGSNRFQSPPDAKRRSGAAEAAVAAAALAEFDALAGLLERTGIDVHVVAGKEMPTCPDEVFPNNWFSTHADGTLVRYPMLAPSRRLERRDDLEETLR